MQTGCIQTSAERLPAAHIGSLSVIMACVAEAHGSETGTNKKSPVSVLFQGRRKRTKKKAYNKNESLQMNSWHLELIRSASFKAFSKHAIYEFTPTSGSPSQKMPSGDPHWENTAAFGETKSQQPALV